MQTARKQQVYVLKKTGLSVITLVVTDFLSHDILLFSSCVLPCMRTRYFIGGIP